MKVTQIVRNRDGEIVPILLAKNTNSLGVISNVVNCMEADPEWYTTIEVRIEF